MTVHAHDFLVESSGPTLPARSALYGAGEDMRRGYAGGIFEKAYHGPVLGVVDTGTFRYRGARGWSLAVPGTVLFGNAGESFSCEHFGSDGNRRSVVAIAPALLDEVADEARRSPSRFPVQSLAPDVGNLWVQAAIRRLARSPHDREDWLFSLLAGIFGLAQVAREGRVDPDARRIVEAAHWLGTSYTEPHRLGDLAAATGLSRFHFLRRFRALIGVSPHQYLIGLRLNAAAERLETGNEPVIDIALAVGFNDLSHFNQLFRRAFAASPREWRRRFSGRSVTAADRPNLIRP